MIELDIAIELPFVRDSSHVLPYFTSGRVKVVPFGIRVEWEGLLRLN